MRFFNTEGPVRTDDHYGIPPLDRIDVDELLGLIRAKRYFVLHAPRQTGKTSALIALRNLLNSGEVGSFRCVNVEPAQVARDDVARGIRAILSGLAMSARLLGDSYPDGIWPDVLAEVFALAPEPIVKGDGAKKNDCERNAAKRLLSDVRREHPHLKRVVVEDGLASNGPHIKHLKGLDLRFLLGAKRADHEALFEWVEAT